MTGSMCNFTAHLRAGSAVRFNEGQGLELSVNAGSVARIVRLSTHYEQVDSVGSVPRFLSVEVDGPAESLEDALTAFIYTAGPVTNVLSTATNAAVGDLWMDLCYDSTPGETEHDFFQQILPADQTTLPSNSRRPDPDAFLALLEAMSNSPKRDRLFRASNQYQMALQHYSPGHEILSLAHLWMSVEALTKVARDDAVARAGSIHDLRSAWGIELKQLDGEVRRRLIFQEDSDTYSDARAASDGLEHGFLDVGVLRRYSTSRLESSAKYVREAIIRYAGVDEPSMTTLLESRFSSPMAVAPMSRYLRATLVGQTENLAAQDMRFPHFVADSRLKSVVRQEDGSLAITPEENLRPSFGDGTVATNLRYELWGPGGGAADGA